MNLIREKLTLPKDGQKILLHFCCAVHYINSLKYGIKEQKTIPYFCTSANYCASL